MHPSNTTIGRVVDSSTTGYSSCIGIGEGKIIGNRIRWFKLGCPRYTACCCIINNTLCPITKSSGVTSVFIHKVHAINITSRCNRITYPIRTAIGCAKDCSIISASNSSSGIDKIDTKKVISNPTCLWHPVSAPICCVKYRRPCSDDCAIVIVCKEYILKVARCSTILAYPR